MLRSKVVRLVAVLSVSVLVIGACGGSDGVSASRYVTDVCTSVGDWATSIQDQSAGLAETLTGDAAQAKEKLEEFFGLAVDATETLISEIDEAGVPDVEGGEGIADDLKAAFESAKEALENAQSGVADLPEDDPAAFQEQAGALGTEFQTAIGDLGATLDEAPELTEAAEDDSACQELGGA